MLCTHRTSSARRAPGCVGPCENAGNADYNGSMKQITSRDCSLRIATLSTLVVLVVSLLGCVSEPPPPVAGNLTADDIKTAMTDAMLVTSDALFSLFDENGRTVSASGSREEEDHGGYRTDRSEGSSSVDMRRDRSCSASTDASRTAGSAWRPGRPS